MELGGRIALQLRIECENPGQVRQRGLSPGRANAPPPHVHVIVTAAAIAKGAGVREQHLDVRVHGVGVVGRIPDTDEMPLALSYARQSGFELKETSVAFATFPERARARHVPGHLACGRHHRWRADISLR